MCNHVKDFLEKMNKLPHSGGHGNDYFEVTFYGNNEISFNDGWNDFPALKLNYCPVCGEKLEKRRVVLCQSKH